MTAVDRPDNGHDEGQEQPRLADTVIAEHLAAQYVGRLLTRKGAPRLVRLIEEALTVTRQDERDRLASARGGAGEQQRELRDAVLALAAKPVHGLYPEDDYETGWENALAEVLALLDGTGEAKG